MSSSWSASPVSRRRSAKASPNAAPTTPAEQLVLINKTVSELASDQQAIWRDLRATLSETGIALVDGHDFTKAERGWLEDHFLRNIFPLLTPLAIDPAHPFPFIPSLGFTIALQLARVSDGKPMNALIRMPGKIDRFIRMPSAKDGAVHLIPLEQATGLFIGRLFPGYTVKGRAPSASSATRTRNRGRGRRSGPPVRDRAEAAPAGSVIRLEMEAKMPESCGFVQQALSGRRRGVLVDGVLAMNELSRSSRGSTGPTSNSCPTCRAIPSGCATMAATSSPRSGRRT